MLKPVEAVFNFVRGDITSHLAAIEAGQADRRHAENTQVARLGALTLQQLVSGEMVFSEDSLLTLKGVLHDAIYADDGSPQVYAHDVDLSGISHPEVIALFPRQEIDCR